MMLRLVLHLAVGMLLSLPLVAAEAAPAAAQEKGQKKDATNAFPGLPLMPAGSVVNGIVLPRYEKGRVVSLITIASLKIESASLMTAKNVSAALYDESGNTTKIVAPSAEVDFATDQMHSDGPISIQDPRFQADGQQLHYDSQRKVGVLRGPVRTVIPATQNYSQR